MLSKKTFGKGGLSSSDNKVAAAPATLVAITSTLPTTARQTSLPDFGEDEEGYFSSTPQRAMNSSSSSPSRRIKFGHDEGIPNDTRRQQQQQQQYQSQQPTLATTIPVALQGGDDDLHPAEQRSFILEINRLEQQLAQRDRELHLSRQELDETRKLLEHKATQYSALLERYEHAQEKLRCAAEHIQEQEGKVNQLKLSLQGEVFDNDSLRSGFTSLIQRAQGDLTKLRLEMEYRERSNLY